MLDLSTMTGEFLDIKCIQKISKSQDKTRKYMYIFENQNCQVKHKIIIFPFESFEIYFEIIITIIRNNEI